MIDNNNRYNDNTKDKIDIKVIGIGGGGNNAVLEMVDKGIQGVNYYLVNTEKSALDRADLSKCKILQIGKELTRGLGAGTDQVVGENAAKENIADIDKILEGTDLLFLTAGMGGGTGTGAIPVFAEEARKLNITTIAIVTEPFLFEGRLRKLRANMGIDKLKSIVNALIVISNDKLLNGTDSSVTMIKAFSLTDDVLRQGIESVTDLINSIGTINIDFADVKTIFSYEGFAYMGIGEVSDGENKIINATKIALNNALTNCSIDDAKGVIFNIRGNSEIGLDDVNRSAEMISEKVNSEANVIFGTIIDENLGDKVIVTVVATGVKEKKESEKSNNDGKRF